jgi:predicted phosphodiesterase
MGLLDDLERQPTYRKEQLGKLAELLDRQGISIDEIGRVQRISLYQSLTKNPETGEADIHDLTAIQFSPAWAEGPTWPVIQPGPTYRLPAAKARKTASETRTAVILPDAQIGYYRASNGELEPIHDEQAIDVALAILKDAQPDQVILVGDNLDFCELGKYVVHAAYRDTTQATIDRGAVFAAQVRAAAGPDARITWIAGNHEERLPKMILQNAAAAFGLKRGNLPESWPVLSVPELCRFGEYGIEYLPGYPASSVWINQRLRVIHGDKVASGGSTAYKYLGSEKTSVIYGHIHRIEYAARTRADWDGAKTIMAASPGCLCRVDGVVPSTKQGVDLDGRPIRHAGAENWQQGLAVVDYEEGDGFFAYEQIAIHEGRAAWRGKTFRSSL